jgi:hypothetical protein
VPIIVGETAFAIEFSRRLLDEVSCQRFRVSRCPAGDSTCGVQMSAAIEEEHIEQALGAFEKVGRELELI